MQPRWLCLTACSITSWSLQGEAIPVKGCPYHKKFLSCVKMNPLLVHLCPLPLVFSILFLVKKEPLFPFIWPWTVWILRWSLYFTVRKDLTPPVLSHGAGSPALWPPSSGGKATEGTVEAGNTRWVLPGPSWEIPRLSDCWHSLHQVETSLLLLGFCQVAATSDNRLLLLLLTICLSWGCCHHFHSVWWVLH